MSKINERLLEFIKDNIKITEFEESIIDCVFYDW
jgi:hypothetical protein